MAESGKFYNIQLADQSASGKVYKVRDVTGEKNVSGKIYQVKGLGGGGVQINNQDINVTQNGVYRAEEGYTGLGTVNVDVPSGTSTQKFGATIDTFLGDVDSNGALDKPTWTSALNFAGVKEISSSCLPYSFYKSKSITGVSFPSLIIIKNNGLYSAFAECPNLVSADFSSLITIEEEGLSQVFRACSNLVSADLSSLETVGESALYYAFYGTKVTNVDLHSLKTVASKGMQYAFRVCQNLVSADFSSLETVGESAWESIFDACGKFISVNLSSLKTIAGLGMGGAFHNSGLASISFPALTDVQKNSFGPSYDLAFSGCAALTEIHFRADMQATIEAMTGYSSKFGATNATIYFDL